LLGNDLLCRFVRNIESEDDIKDDEDRIHFEKSNLLIRFGQLLKKYDNSDELTPEIKAHLRRISRKFVKKESKTIILC